MRLNGKTAIITGAAGNLGAASAKAYAREGANLVLVDLNQEGLEALASEIGGNVEILRGNIVKSATIEAAFDIADKSFGGVDIFFANGGIEGISSVVPDYPEDVYDKVMEVNVKSVFLAIQTVTRRMKDGGAMMITSSVMGLKGTPLNIAYIASKHAVVGLRRSAAIALGKRGIRVNTIHPGFVDSEMLRRLMSQHEDPEASHRMFVEMAKLGRLVQPEDIAQMAVFLGSDESRNVTNQALVVDAGVLD